MRAKFLTFVIGLMTTAGPAFAQSGANHTFLGPFEPSFSYQSPDGSYPSYTDFSLDLWGMPCGLECTRKAAIRWGLVPPPRPLPLPRYHYRHHHYHY